MRILVVASQSKLQTVEDWMSSMNGNQVTVLDGLVTGREVLQSIASGGYQVVHFAGHGCEDAIEVSDGVIPKHLLEDAFRAARTVELVILGACRSIGVGALLYMAGVPRVLSWRADVDDQIAGTWARAFYSSLRLTGDIWDATQTASAAVLRIGAEPPIYLNGRMALLETEVKRLQKRTKFGGMSTWLVGTLTVYGILIAAILMALLR